MDSYSEKSVSLRYLVFSSKVFQVVQVFVSARRLFVDSEVFFPNQVDFQSIKPWYPTAYPPTSK
jgi:hypothetical protein